MSRITLVVVALALTILTSACNTVAGAGEDVSHAGHAVTNSAEDNK